MTQDLMTTIGLDDRPARQGLKRWEQTVHRSQTRIARDFERHERAKAREAEAAERKRADAFRNTQKIHKIATVAIVAGIGAITAALEEAAKSDANIANSLKQVGDQYKGLKADIGRDLGNGGMLGYLSKALGVVRELRNNAVDAVGAFLGGDTAEQRRVENEQLQRDEQFRQARAAQDIRDETFGGDDAQRRIRDLNKRIADERIGPQAADELRQRLAREIAAEQADAAREAARVAQAEALGGRAATMGRQAERATIAAGQTETLDDDRSAARLRYEAEIAEATAKAYARQGDEAQRAKELREEELVIGARYAEELRKIDELEAERAARAEKASRDAARRHALDLADMRIQTLRLTGRKEEADILEREVEHEERLARIRADEALTEQQRAEAIAAAEELRNAQAAGMAGDSEGRGFDAGLTGGATLLRQILGDGSQRPQNETAKNTAKMVSILEAIRENTGRGSVALAG